MIEKEDGSLLMCEAELDMRALRDQAVGHAAAYEQMARDLRQSAGQEFAMERDVKAKILRDQACAIEKMGEQWRAEQKKYQAMVDAYRDRGPVEAEERA